MYWKSNRNGSEGGKQPGNNGETKFTRDAAYCVQNAVKAPIPKMFRKSFGGYFRYCVGCRRPLRADAIELEHFEDGICTLRPYLIVKSVRHGEPWIEYAMCVRCLEKLQASLSIDSNARVEKLFDSRVALRRRFELLTTAEADPAVWVSSCILTGTHRTQASNYQMIALCSDDDLLLSATPYSICGDGLKEFEDCHSQQSKKKERKFIKHCLGVEAAMDDRYPR